MSQYKQPDPVITNIVRDYSNAQFIAEQVFPYFPVAERSAKHYRYDFERFRIENTKRSKGDRANEVTHNVTAAGTYYCEDHALKEFVADEDKQVAARVRPDPEAIAARNIMAKIKVEEEKSLADMLTDTANVTQNTTLSGTDQWSDYNNSDPFDDVMTARREIHSNIFRYPNTAIISAEVEDQLLHHPALLDRFKWSERGFITREMLKMLFKTERVLVGEAGFVSSKEGQTESKGYIWGKHAVLAYIEPTPDRFSVTAGFTYQWVGNEFKGLIAEKWRGVDENDRRGSYVRVGDHFIDQQIFLAESIYLIKNSVA
jgi:hypothetical protein